MRRPLRVFEGLTSVDGRLGFYTQETKDLIPQQPGCYAWFLPLWIYRPDLASLMTAVGDIYGYQRKPEKLVSADFNWHSVSMRIRSDIPAAQTSADLHDTWDQIVADDEAKAALQQLLLEASILMPPLYVGRTTNLKVRYLQHLTETRGKNDFHSRFKECIARSNITLSVGELLFACVRTQNDLGRKLEQFHNVELLVEQILMQFCRPPFSLR